MESAPLAPPGYSRTFYKRQLPSPPAIAFASDRGKQVFAQALAAGTMNNFFKLIEQFRTQDEPAYCGLASLAMTLNTLSIDPRRTWKGPWRWFHEEMLDCCHPLPKVREEGITLTQAACLARCNGARVELYPHGAVGVDEFRAMVTHACSSAEEHIIVSYSRRQFLQTGDGHFSPIGGYSASEDMVLILDTARFKYPPHWVPLTMLHSAMAHIDPSTGRPRGFMRMGRHPRLDSVLFTLDVRDAEWQQSTRYLEQQMPARILAAAAAPAATAIDVLAAALAAAPTASLRKFVAVRTAGSATHGGVCVQTAVVRTFLTELRSMPLFGELAAALPQWRQQCGGGVDELVATNCYTPGSAGCGDDSAAVGCCGPAPSGPRGVAVGVEAAAQLQQQTDRQQHAGQLPEQEQTQQQAGRQQTWQQPQEQQQTEVQQAEQGGGQEALCAPPGPLPSSPSADLRATAAAASSPALAASAAEPAVREDLSLERACMLLLMAPRELWRGIPDERLRGEVLALLDASSHAVVAAEAEYLAAQLFQLPIMQQALEESEASGHTCAGDYCAAPGCQDTIVGGISGSEGGDDREEEEEEQGWGEAEQQQPQQQRVAAHGAH
ncbi:hypothetical protein D9Q98_009475 [Chlorella vulgaris]|uniref:glutathione gamma-glutamylcysteinyltransferase n=1 Tax=Chlorella vulgaris TaxID=3077 RepID=A0A9D4TFA7_CHLVU|nr:hypothetical protein D9Q98_009475 [Chlorella vulgaris]